MPQDSTLFLDLLRSGALRSYQNATPLEQTAYRLFGLVPGLQRANILPFAGSRAGGDLQVAAPQFLYDIAKSAIAPGAAFAGQYITPQETVNAAANLVGVGGATAPAMQAGDLAMNAWHGSGRRGITRFSDEFIGLGTGKKDYGHGHYFARNKETAEAYRKKLSQKSSIVERGKNDYAVIDPEGKTVSEGLLYDQAQRIKGEYDNVQGQLYQVDIPEKTDMLDWDRPISEQPDSVKQALISLSNKLNRNDDKNKYFFAAIGENKSGADVYRGLQASFGGGSKLSRSGDVEASNLLRKNGVKGLTYSDKSMDLENYVVFSGDDIRILGKD